MSKLFEMYIFHILFVTFKVNLDYLLSVKKRHSRKFWHVYLTLDQSKCCDLQNKHSCLLSFACFSMRIYLSSEAYIVGQCNVRDNESSGHKASQNYDRRYQRIAARANQNRTNAVEVGTNTGVSNQIFPLK